MAIYQIQMMGNELGGTLVSANSTFCYMLGYTSLGEVMGKTWNEILHPDSMRTLKSHLSRQPRGQSLSVEQVYVHRSGGYFKTIDTHTLLLGSDGVPVTDMVWIDLPDMEAPNIVSTPPSTIDNRAFIGNADRSFPPSATNSPSQEGITFNQPLPIPPALGDSGEAYFYGDGSPVDSLPFAFDDNFNMDWSGT